MLARIFMRTRRIRRGPPAAEHLRNLHVRVWPDAVSADAVRLHRLETAPYERAALEALVGGEAVGKRLHECTHGGSARTVRGGDGADLVCLAAEDGAELVVRRAVVRQRRDVAGDPGRIQLLRHFVQILNAQPRLAVLIILKKRRDGRSHACAAHRLLVDGRHARTKGHARRMPTRDRTRAYESLPKGPHVLRLGWRKYVRGLVHLPP